MSYSPEKAQAVLDLIATDHTLDQIHKLTGVDRITVWRWVQAKPDFAAAITRAREQQADFLAENIRTIASKVQNGELLPEQGKVAAGLMQWLAAKRKPKTYGDKMTLAGDAENPLFNLGKRMDALRQRREQRQLAAPVIDVTPVKEENANHPGEQFA